ncbi:uncharacterized protein LOC134341190 isoform X2 [Mobula hypostoma]|uniref:uncharacterized protein LOC134341190 isoform X2 n=1 Tax=Mobula hypostoma TaxID=723540 RepID=UPI002FC3BE4A
MGNLCNVQCYGRGDIHEEIVKKLEITQCERPDFPCILFVYKVSRETEDLRNALQWVTEKQGVRREDIGAVVLLEKSLDKRSKSVDVAHQGMFDDKTVVVRILWKQRQNSTGKIPKSPISNLQAMDKIKQSIKKCQDIYRVVIGTKFELLGIQEDDHEQIYEYKPLQNKFTMLSDLTGMEKRSMFVVSNQWRGDQIEMIKCILALSALDNMIRNIDKFLKVTK